MSSSESQEAEVRVLAGRLCGDGGMGLLDTVSVTAATNAGSKEKERKGGSVGLGRRKESGRDVRSQCSLSQALGPPDLHWLTPRTR